MAMDDGWAQYSAGLRAAHGPRANTTLRAAPAGFLPARGLDVARGHLQSRRPLAGDEKLPLHDLGAHGLEPRRRTADLEPSIAGQAEAHPSVDERYPGAARALTEAQEAERHHVEPASVAQVDDGAYVACPELRPFQNGQRVRPEGEPVLPIVERLFGRANPTHAPHGQAGAPPRDRGNQGEDEEGDQPNPKHPTVGHSVPPAELCQLGSASHCQAASSSRVVARWQSAR